MPSRILLLEKYCDKLIILREPCAPNSLYDVGLNRGTLPNYVGRWFTHETFSIFQETNHRHGSLGQINFFWSESMHELVPDVDYLFEQHKKLAFCIR